MRGKYIVIEGNDGTGKSTQVGKLAEYLRSVGHETIVVEEPGSDDIDKSTAVANYLRKIIKDGSLVRDPEINLALFSAARRDLWFNKIEPALASGKFILAARNYFSTLAYQGSGEGLNADHIIDTTRLFTSDSYMTPDQTIVLLLENDRERLNRINQRGQLEAPDTFESKDSRFQAKVDKAYRDLAVKYKLPTIDCTKEDKYKSVEDVQREIIELLNI